MRCPVCKREMKEVEYGVQTEDGDVSTYYHCYNHGGGAVFLSVTWREYTKRELDYE